MKSAFSHRAKSDIYPSWDTEVSLWLSSCLNFTDFVFPPDTAIICFRSNDLFTQKHPQNFSELQCIWCKDASCQARALIQSQLKVCTLSLNLIMKESSHVMCSYHCDWPMFQIGLKAARHTFCVVNIRSHVPKQNLISFSKNNLYFFTKNPESQNFLKSSSFSQNLSANKNACWSLTPQTCHKLMHQVEVCSLSWYACICYGTACKRQQKHWKVHLN